MQQVNQLGNVRSLKNTVIELSGENLVVHDANKL